MFAVIIDRQVAEIVRLRHAIDEVRAELEDDFDITDSGGPNKAMRLANMLDEAIYGPGGFR